MTAFLANCNVAVYRATALDGAGDVVDDNTTPVVGLESIVAAITEKSRQVFDQASETNRTVRWAVGRVQYGIALQRNDRLKNLTTGKFYAVDAMTKTRSIGGGLYTVLDLRTY